MKKGKFVVIDGLDGVGKGVFIRALMDAAKNDGKRIFNLHDFWRSHDYLPDVKDIISNFDVAITAEPTFCGIGRSIRLELTAKNNRSYSPEIIASAYALDRQILYEKVVLPLLDAGVDVYQSRSFSTSIVYQRQQAMDSGIKFDVNDILSIPGNAFCYRHPMDFLIIPTINDVQQVMDRLRDRDKQDNCEFENIDFQLKVKQHYESKEFQSIFENMGVKIVFMDAGRTIEYSKEQAIDFYTKNLSEKTNS